MTTKPRTNLTMLPVNSYPACYDYGTDFKKRRELRECRYFTPMKGEPEWHAHPQAPFQGQLLKANIGGPRINTYELSKSFRGYIRGRAFGIRKTAPAPPPAPPPPPTPPMEETAGDVLESFVEKITHTMQLMDEAADTEAAEAAEAELADAEAAPMEALPAEASPAEAAPAEAAPAEPAPAEPALAEAAPAEPAPAEAAEAESAEASNESRTQTDEGLEDEDFGENDIVINEGGVSVTVVKPKREDSESEEL